MLNAKARFLLQNKNEEVKLSMLSQNTQGKMWTSNKSDCLVP